MGGIREDKQVESSFVLLSCHVIVCIQMAPSPILLMSYTVHLKTILVSYDLSTFIDCTRLIPIISIIQIPFLFEELMKELSESPVPGNRTMAHPPIHRNDSRISNTWSVGITMKLCG
jgi:hypothetical protein